ncbi:MAG TPA: response regulator transcription factor [Thermoanaerobaculia bacterium]|nr:response regulator transcription factor [Thermoanaerobaculia bacterium]
MRQTIILADDHSLVRQGIRMLLERENFLVVGEAPDGSEAVRLAEEHQPDIAVLDLSMPVMNGITAVGHIRKVSPRTRIVLLTMHTEEHHVLQALRSGVKACVTKTQAVEHLIIAIREVCNGGVYLSPSVSGAVVQAYLTKTEVPYDPLTDRERQVLQLVAEGNTTKEIALLLGVAAKTAETHRVKVMEKLDIHSTAGLVRYAIRRGLVQA